MKNYKKSKIKLDDKRISEVSAGLLDTLRGLGEKLGITKNKNEAKPLKVMKYGCAMPKPWWELETKKIKSDQDQ